MTKEFLTYVYRKYIECLNAQDWDSLKKFVHENAVHNGKRLGIQGYREMLIDDYRMISDLHFTVELIICEPPMIACRLSFHCTPENGFLGLVFNGQSVHFTENVFYEFKDRLIYNVLSVIDKAQIEKQLIGFGNEQG